MKNTLKRWSPALLFAALALSNTSFLISDNSRHGQLSFASRIPTEPKKSLDLDLCGSAKDQTTNEKVDLKELFIATAEVTSDMTAKSSAHLKNADMAFAESLYTNLSELEKKGFDQVELMNGGDEAISFCLPKVIDEAMGKSASYATQHEKLSKLTNYLGHQGVANPAQLAQNLLFVQEKIKK